MKRGVGEGVISGCRGGTRVGRGDSRGGSDGTGGRKLFLWGWGGAMRGGGVENGPIGGGRKGSAGDELRSLC